MADIRIVAEPSAAERMPTANERRRLLRTLLARANGPTVAPGVYDCLTTRLVEEAGFDAAMVTGAGVAASLLGVPDVGLMTMTEVVAHSRNIVAATSLPIIADADTGYGNALNVMRAIRELEAAGVAALFIEDQAFPKRCGHFRDKHLVSASEMASKLRAANEARVDSDLLIIARTDAIAVAGFADALARAKLYADAGADALFIEAPESVEQLTQIPIALRALGLPLMVNLVEGGKTPLLSSAKLGALGYALVTYSGSLQKAAIAQMEGLLESLRETGTVEHYFPDRMVSLARRSSLLGLERYERWASEFAE